MDKYTVLALLNVLQFILAFIACCLVLLLGSYFIGTAVMACVILGSFAGFLLTIVVREQAKLMRRRANRYPSSSTKE
jgi:hypothetical protein